MSSVFVIGASGYIGSGVARAFAAKGYTVYGLTRSQDKVKALRKLEIIPVVGKAQEPKDWESIAASCDIIIEALSDHQDHSSAVTAQKTLLDILAKNKHKIVIYTSGVWVYGNTTHPVDENSQLNPTDLVKARPAHEKVYLDAGATVLRPGCVYGKEASLIGMWLGQLKGGKGEFPGFPNNEPVWSLVHVDDLADAYVRTAQKGESLRGQVINVVSQSENVRDIIKPLAAAVGFKGEIKFVEPKDPFSTALALSQRHILSTKARLVLGWNPQHVSASVGADNYYKSWEAFQ